MAQRQSVSILPKNVLFQLHERLIDSNFGSYSEHSAWLLSLGFSISKSAIHRYGIENEAQIRLNFTAMDKSSDELRMRCLELAERLSGKCSNELLFKRAEELLNWVRIR